MNKQYLVRDANEIFGIYKEITHAYTTLLQYIYLTFKNTNDRNSIDTVIESFQILEYDTNVVENIYNVGIDFYLYDINKKIHVCDKISIRDYIAKLNKFTSNNVINNIDTDMIDSKELDIFIPMTEVTETLDLKNRSREKLELEAKLKMLQNIKQQEAEKLEKIKNTKVHDMNIINEKHDRELFVETMKANDAKHLEEKRKKFMVDMNVFMRLEKEIEENKRDSNNIPELFVNEFKIFTTMRENNIFAQSDDNKFAYYMAHYVNDNHTGKFSQMFTQPSITELKKLEFSDTDSIYDDNYSEDSSDSSDDEDLPDTEEHVDINDEIMNMQSIIDDEI